MSTMLTKIQQLQAIMEAEHLQKAAAQYSAANPFLQRFKLGQRVLVLDKTTGNKEPGIIIRVSCYACYVHLDSQPPGTWVLAMNDILRPEPPKENSTMTTTAPSTTAVINARNTAAVKALISVARRQETITADDVLTGLDPSYASLGTRFMSALMADSARAGLIRKTDRVIRSKRTGGPLTVWTSLVVQK